MIEKPTSRIHVKVVRPGRGHVAALAIAGKFAERICCFRGFNPAKDNAAYLPDPPKEISAEEFQEAAA